MAEQLQNATAAPDTTTTEAVTAGTTTDFDVADGSVFPATGAFRIVVRGSNDNGSDDALGTVGSRTGNNLASITWIDNGQTTFASGAGVDIVLSAEGLDAAIDDRVATHEALTTAHASATNLIHTTGNETLGGTKTFSSPIVLPNGSAAAPSLAFSSDLDVGVYRRTTNQLGMSVNGTERAYLTTVAFITEGNMIANGGLYSGVVDSSTALTITGNTQTNVEITSANAVLTLPQVTFGASITPVFRIADPLRLISGANPAKLSAWGDGFSFNSINEADGALGIWDDQVGNYGPGSLDGLLPLTTPGGVWQLTRLRNDPGVAFATGGWHCVQISDGNY